MLESDASERCVLVVGQTLANIVSLELVLARSGRGWSQFLASHGCSQCCQPRRQIARLKLHDGLAVAVHLSLVPSIFGASD